MQSRAESSFAGFDSAHRLPAIYKDFRPCPAEVRAHWLFRGSPVPLMGGLFRWWVTYSIVCPRMASPKGAIEVGRAGIPAPVSAAVLLTLANGKKDVAGCGAAHYIPRPCPSIRRSARPSATVSPLAWLPSRPLHAFRRPFMPLRVMTPGRRMK
jgi:hypothetical protein